MNLGFSGNAKAEPEIAAYISNLSMSAFVYDYDHNAPTPEYLEQTHAPMFRKIRDKNPDLPILIMSRPKWALTDADVRRRAVTYQTYEKALATGDRNVYFLDGHEIVAQLEGEGMVDQFHPTDLGFAYMAEAVIKVLKKIL